MTRRVEMEATVVPPAPPPPHPPPPIGGGVGETGVGGGRRSLTATMNETQKTNKQEFECGLGSCVCVRVRACTCARRMSGVSAAAAQTTRRLT